MAQPTPYERAYNFANFQSTSPSDPLPGAQVDLELNLVKTSLDETQSNLALIQRDDGAVANQSIGYEQLKAELDGFGFNPPTEWATETNYVVRDTVFESAGFYRCTESHISGVFATDLAAGKWVQIADFTAATTDAQTAQAAAEAAQLAAETAETNAETAATNASASASAAATSATNAASSASAAATSATNAASSASAAVTSATNAASSATAAGSDADRAESARDDALAAVPSAVFVSIASLRLFSAETEATTAFVIGWHALSLKGGGYFTLDSADASTADDSGYTIVDAAGRRWKRVDIGQKPMPTEFGAKGDGATDDATAIQNCLNYGQSTAKGMHIPAGTYLYGSTITQKAACEITGDGQRQSWLVYTGSFSAWFVNPDGTYANDNTFYKWQGFGITPQASGGGTYGFICTVAGTEYLSNWKGEDMYIGAFGTRGMYLNNTGGGIFSGIWRDGWVSSGIQGNTIGDSIKFERLTVNSLIGTMQGLLITQIAGAREIVFEHLNVTCLGGGATLGSSVNGAVFLNCWFELPSYAGDYSGGEPAYVVIYGNNCKLWNCVIQPLYSISVSVTYAILLAGNDNEIKACEISQGETSHIRVTGVRNIIRDDNQGIGDEVITISDAAVTTRNFYAPPRFRAYRSTTQTGVVAATYTKVAFDTEVVDTGGMYDDTTFRWTPPAGLVDLRATVLITAVNMVDNELATLAIYKNGVILTKGSITGTRTATAVGMTAAATDLADGDDYYEMFVNIGTAAGDKSLSSGIANTNFEGTWLRAS